MSERAPYSRVYWTVRDDPRLVDIYADDHHWATWNRLLLAADMAWPAPADMPASVRRASLRALEAAGVLELLPGGLFRFHGLEAERGRRREAAAYSAAHRSGTGRVPNAPRTGTERTPDGVLASRDSRDEPRRAETSRADADGRDDLEAWLAVKFRAPTPAQRTFLDGYCRTFDVTGPARAERLIFAHPDDPIAALKADLEAWREERRQETTRAEVPKPPVHRPASKFTGINAELAAMFRAKDEGATT